MTTLVDVFSDVARQNGDREAIVEPSGGAITFEALERLTLSYSAAFRQRDIQKGDRILLAMPIGIDLYASLAALWRLGATVVFPEPAMGLKGLRHAARVTKPKAFLSAGWYQLLGWFVPELRRIEITLKPKRSASTGIVKNLSAENDIALISFTSGSTGNPKAIARSHEFMMAQAKAISPLLETRGGNERDLVAFPVFVLVCLSLGITSVLPKWKLSKHDKVGAKQIISQLKENTITRMLVPPVICETLSREDALPDLRAIFTGGGPVFPDTFLRLSKLNPKMQLTAVYGSTEAEPISHLNFDKISQSDLDAMASGRGLLAGKPVDDINVEIVDTEIQVAGMHVNESYLDTSQNAENKVARGGRIWHRTGDSGQIDSDGRIWLLGRCGRRVGDLEPFAIETATRFWPGLKRSALVELNGKPALAIQGNKEHFDSWVKHAAELGITNLRLVKAIPMDSRHRSKIDHTRLQKMLS